MNQYEAKAQCPYCWSEQSVFIDPGAEQQSGVFDCVVCCQPIEFEAELSEEGIESFKVQEGWI